MAEQIVNKIDGIGRVITKSSSQIDQGVTNVTNLENEGRLVAVEQELSTIHEGSMASLESDNWEIKEISGVLYFSFNGTKKAKLDSSGNLTVVGDVITFGTV